MAPRFILDEFNVDLPPLATRLVIVVVVVVAGSSRNAGPLHASSLSAIAIAGRKRVILGRGRLLMIGVNDVGHDVFEMINCEDCSW